MGPHICSPEPGAGQAQGPPSSWTDSIPSGLLVRLMDCQAVGLEDYMSFLGLLYVTNDQQFGGLRHPTFPTILEVRSPKLVVLD